MSERSELDAVDERLLAALRGDARLSIRALAERVKVSRAAVHSRLRRLHEGGVIAGYEAVVDPGAVGLTLSAFVQLRISQDAWRTVKDQVRTIPEVWHAAMVSGDHDLVLLVRTTDAAALRDLVLDRLRTIPGVNSTHTVLILDEIPDVLAGRPATARPQALPPVSRDT